MYVVFLVPTNPPDIIYYLLILELQSEILTMTFTFRPTVAEIMNEQIIGRPHSFFAPVNRMNVCIIVQYTFYDISIQVYVCNYVYYLYVIQIIYTSMLLLLHCKSRWRIGCFIYHFTIWEFLQGQNYLNNKTTALLSINIASL